MKNGTRQLDRSLEALKDFLFRRIAELGWAPQEQLLSEAQRELDADALSVHQALRFLVRQDYVTIKDGPQGLKGYEVMPPPKRRGASRYGDWSPLTILRGTFLTHSLGCMTRPGKDTEAFLIRTPDRRIIIPRSYVVAMLKRACLLLDRGDVPQTAVRRWDVAPILLPADTPVETVMRRVIRPDGRTAEPIWHEAIAPGVSFSVSFRYPQSHFSRELVLELWDVAARSVGLSTAGGANGRWGIFSIDNIAEMAMSISGGGQGETS